MSRNGKPFSSECDLHRDELVQALCDEHTPAQTPAALRLHQAVCPSCRAELLESRMLVDELRTALTPEPLSAALSARLAHADETATLVLRPRWHRLTAPLAAAAAIVLGMAYLPASLQRLGVDAGQSSATVATHFELSETEAAEIASAFGLLEWSTLDDAVSKAAKRLEGLKQIVDREPGAGSVLPWGPEDDWDTASTDALPRTHGTSSRKGAAT